MLELSGGAADRLCETSVSPEFQLTLALTRYRNWELLNPPLRGTYQRPLCNELGI